MYNVLCIINNQYHPQSPFPVPVYDASEIIVSEIVSKAVIKSTVEFTGLFLLFLFKYCFIFFIILS